jgi:cytochrome c-type biogenesis protein CcmH/NrfF
MRTWKISGVEAPPRKNPAHALILRIALLFKRLNQPRLLRSALLVLAMAAAGIAQNGADLESQPVLRVAGKLKCSCGCNQNMACQMPGGCQVCKTNRTKIFQMQQGGMTDQQILDSYVAEKGKDVLVIPPGIGGALGPYVALGLGFLAVLWTIRRYSRKRPALTGAMAGAGAGAGAEIDPATLAEIEKNMANLD